ncbi:acyl-CoA carboxylase subunit epsilon [Georgenia sp. AZ-5]|uniref:acyl-CoA carboxylase subunit epsilon n=1 Tax=Georgenia sp. AZ-5 TaxID=3367526 RepID=UPI00375406C9
MSAPSVARRQHGRTTANRVTPPSDGTDARVPDDVAAGAVSLGPADAVPGTTGPASASPTAPAPADAPVTDQADPEALDGGPALMTSPAVRVVKGRPDEVELAALVAGIVAARARSDELAGIPDEGAEPVRSRWTDRARRLGMTPAPDAGAWRWSLQP